MIGELDRAIDEIDTYLSSMPDSVIEEALAPTIFGSLDTAAGIFAEDAAALRRGIAGLEPFSDDYLIARFQDCYALQPLEVTHRALFERDADIVAVKVNHGFWEHLAGLFGTGAWIGRYRDMNLPARRRHYLQGDFLFAFQRAWSRLTSDRGGTVVPMISISSAVGPTRLRRGRTLRIVQRATVTGMVAYELAGAGSRPAEARPADPLPIHDSYVMSKGYEEGLVFDRVIRKADERSAVLTIGPRWTGSFRLRGVAGRQYFLGLSQGNVMPLWRQTTAKILAVFKHLAGLHERIVVLLQSSAYSPIAGAAIMDVASAAGRAVEVWDLGRLLDVPAGSDVSKTGSPLPSGDASRIASYFERCAEPQLIFQERTG